MSDHPNVETVNAMTKAIFDQDHDALAKIFTDDLVFHLRGPHPMAGDHAGLGGLLDVLGSIFETTNGQIELDQQFCLGADGWAAEWEHATLGRNGKTARVRATPSCTGSRATASPRCGCSSARCPTRPRRSSADRAGRLGETGAMVRAIEDARAACDEQPLGRRLAAAGPTLDRRRASTSTTSTGAPPPPTSPATTRRASPAGPEPTSVCLADGRGAPGGATSAAKLAQGLGFKGDLGRCRGWVDRTRPPPRARPASTASSRATSSTGSAMLRIFEAGDIAGAHAHFVQAGKIGARFAHRELVTLARIGEGRMLIYLGDIAEGMALLDEAMVSIEAGELSPLATGDAYCTVIDACSELFDLGRCRAWTDSFARWCDTQQELVLYRGHCFLHRAEVLGLLGRVARGARRGPARLRSPGRTRSTRRPLGGGLRRSRATSSACVGDLDGAEAAYQRASEHGRDPQPGLALLRLAQGRLDAADADDPARPRRGRGPDRRGLACSAPTSRSCSPPATSPPRVPPPTSSVRWPPSSSAPPLLRAHARRGPPAPCSSPKATPQAALVELRRAFNEFNGLGVRLRRRPHPPAHRRRVRGARRPRRRRDGVERGPRRARVARRGRAERTTAEPAPTRPTVSPSASSRCSCSSPSGKTNRVIAAGARSSARRPWPAT